MTKDYEIKRHPNGMIAIDQGEVHGLPVMYNPDDDLFYVHKPGSTDAEDVLARIKNWRRVVSYARRKSKETEAQRPPAAPPTPEAERRGEP